MTEMFCDESSEMLRNMRKCFLESKDNNAYGQEIIQELFRGVHTLKANSTMMLFESMSELSNAMESLLYCFRGGDKKITEVARFDKVMQGYLDFFEQETDKLAEGKTPDGTAKEIENEIREFTAEVMAQMSEGETEEYKKSVSKPKRQTYYIASASNEKAPAARKKKKITVPEVAVQRGEPGAAAPESVPSQTDAAEGRDGEEHAKANKKKFIITEVERQRVGKSVRNLLRILDSMEYALGDGDEGIFTRKQFERLQEICADLKLVRKELVNTDFVPVAKKMEIVVDEMSEKLHKPVKLSIKGQQIPVGSRQRDKISGALIHIIRNAIDHGIEDRETRQRLGKSPMGLIKLRFFTENGCLRVSVKDDGCGIDTEKILEAAEKQSLLTKPAEEYTEKEIYGLMLVSGLTTTEEENMYSGRGVGMDVISHNVSEMGGKLKISSKKGLGTTITMKF